MWRFLVRAVASDQMGRHFGRLCLAASMPAQHEISAGMASGLVWTNPTTKVYHKGGEFYGRTKNGTFMTEAEAVRHYYRPSPDVMRARGE